jgi:hypothetical protein
VYLIKLIEIKYRFLLIENAYKNSPLKLYFVYLF